MPERKVFPVAREMTGNRMKTVQEDIRARHAMLMTWLVLGNVAGLYFVLDRAAAGALPANVPAATLYLTFLVGAASAFLALLIGLLVGIGILNSLAWIWAVQLGDTISDEQDALATSKANGLRNAANWLIPSHLLTAVSAIAFVTGLSAPLWVGDELFGRPSPTPAAVSEPAATVTPPPAAP